MKENIFTQLGQSIKELAIKLNSDKELNELLVNMSNDPLSNVKEKNFEPSFDFLNGTIRTVPRVKLEDIKTGIISVFPDYGTVDSENLDFSMLNIKIDIFLPFDSWQINNNCQRPYLIMSKILEKVNLSRITGIGQLIFEDFSLNVVDDDIGVHEMRFSVDAIS